MKKDMVALTEYKTAIDHLAKSKTSFAFQNSGPAHASIVISAILKNAENVVRIYANNISGVISDLGDYLESIEHFIVNGKKLMLVVKGEVPSHSNLLQLLKNLLPHYPNLKVKKASSLFVSSTEKILDKEIFFVVGDKSSYRIEFNNQTHVAICNFDDEEVATKLITTFDEHFDKCPNLI